MIKILHIIDSFGLYGAEIMLLNLMQEQKKSGMAPILLSLQPAEVENEINTLIKEALNRGLDVETINSESGFHLSQVSDICRVAKDRKIDLIHSHGYKGNILLAIIPKFILNVPRISTVHGWVATKKYTKLWIYRLIDRLSLRKMSAVVNVNSVMPIIKNNDITFVVENGISELEFNPELIKEENPLDYNFCKTGFTIGVISRLSLEKGLVYIIRAMSLLVQKYPDFKLIIIGGGPEKTVLQRLIIDLDLSTSILLTGYRRDAYNYLPLFDIYALPSLSEGLPMTILEAMHAMVPIVASKVGGIPKALGNGKNGKLVEPANIDMLVEAILSLRETPSIVSEFTRAAKVKVIENYSTGRMAEDYNNIYKMVLK